MTMSEAKTKSVYRLKPLNQSKEIFAKDNFIPVSNLSSAQGVYMKGSTDYFEQSRRQAFSMSKDARTEMSSGKRSLLGSIKSKNRLRLENAIMREKLPMVSQSEMRYQHAPSASYFTPSKHTVGSTALIQSSSKAFSQAARMSIEAPRKSSLTNNLLSQAWLDSKADPSEFAISTIKLKSLIEEENSKYTSTLKT